MLTKVLHENNNTNYVYWPKLVIYQNEINKCLCKSSSLLFSTLNLIIELLQFTYKIDFGYLEFQITLTNLQQAGPRAQTKSMIYDKYLVLSSIIQSSNH